MNREDLYKAISENETVPKVVYHLGVDAGFFSEYNNMILCLVYCLENKLRFSIYSKDANFRIKNGWTDFFLPFCKEEQSFVHSFINQRPGKLYKKELISKVNERMISIGRKILNQTLLMSDIWNEARSQNINKRYNFPSLSIEGDLRDVCRKLIEQTWIYSSDVQKQNDTLLASLMLPDKYIGFHIRGGDKFIEAEKQEVDLYIEKSMSLSGCRSAFVLTDDYTVIEQLQQRYPEWTFYTLCGKEERGYFHKQFKAQSLKEKERNMIKLFTSVDIIADSLFFIGTFSSNPGMYLGMRMHPEKTFSVDIPEWKIW